MANSTAPDRVDYLWFPDADLVLRAENSPHMTTLPQPMPLEDETVDGCIVVRLHDSAAEAKCFLRAIFDSSFFMPPPSPVLLTTVIGVMRLAHKYHIPYLFRRALSHLDVLYPTTLSEFQTSTSPFPCRKDHHIIPDAESVSLVRAVSEVGALWLLPAVYYSWINELPPSSDAFNNLQPDELRLCWAAQLQCIRAVGMSYRFLRNLPTVSCSSTECIDVICQAQDSVDRWSELQNGNSALDLDLNPLGPGVFSYMNDPQLCPNCETVSRRLFSEAQKQVWEQLPGMFTLPTWEQLIKMRQKVLKE
ncbi:BTB domain-containing protein [Favolaschia claudopus]|uniref:BTB domain-containing protein n=1 Tax=Favolaschia claudopus TaxID=2862362 RepID=A0AAW0AJQ9_9AGAR